MGAEGSSVLVGTTVKVETAAMVCANKGEADDCAVLFTSVRLIFGNSLFIDEIPQAVNKMMITEDSIDIRLEVFIRNCISTSQTKFYNQTSLYLRAKTTSQRAKICSVWVIDGYPPTQLKSPTTLSEDQ